MRRIAALLALLCACEQPAAEAGRELFEDPRGFSDSSMSIASCADCHDTTAEPDPSRLRPGYTMFGVVARPRYWGGQVETLLEAVNTCIVYFQQGVPLDPDSDKARQLFEYLASLSPDGSPAEALPMTIVENIASIPLGDAARGEALYDLACRFCHDAAHSGRGGLADFALPEDTDSYDVDFPGVPPGLVVIEKIRHGRFFSVGGVMPFYSVELMSDAEIGDLLAYLGLSSTP